MTNNLIWASVLRRRHFIIHNGPVDDDVNVIVKTSNIAPPGRRTNRSDLTSVNETELPVMEDAVKKSRGAGVVHRSAPIGPLFSPRHNNMSETSPLKEALANVSTASDFLNNGRRMNELPAAKD